WQTFDRFRQGNTSGYREHLAQLRSTMHALYQLLVAPLTNLPTRLVIIPDGPLHGLGFDHLLTAMPEPGTAVASCPWLVQDHAISYALSLSTWLEMAKTKPPGNRVVAIKPDFSHHSYASLPDSEAALGSIGKQFKLHSLDNRQATVSQLEAQSGAAIIQFVTHAVLHDSIGDLSFIVMGKEDGSLDSLEVHQVYSMDFPGTFFYIPNCDTHRGEYVQGEGVLSLARAFAYAGASGMVAGLWPVPDRSSGIIATHFYENMHKRMPKDVAFRDAKLTYLAQSTDDIDAHPYQWGSLVLVGNTVPVQGRNTWLTGLAALFLLFAGTIAVQQQRAQRTVKAA
ncbi:MAG: CHAT domain-containing protein, partial [Saprospiraceae bacterium]|nr:CHAT domain-containing protein [Saprospiraceae bacterium]